MTFMHPGQDEWGRVKLRLKAELGEDVFTSWFNRVDLERCANGTVHLSVPTRFLKNWLQGRYRDRLMLLCRDEFESVSNIEFSVRGAAVRPLTPPPAGVETPTIDMRPITLQPKIVSRSGAATPAVELRAELRHADDSLTGSPLDQRYSFDSFVEGRSNSFALAAARKAADQRPGEPVGGDHHLAGIVDE